MSEEGNKEKIDVQLRQASTFLWIGIVLVVIAPLIFTQFYSWFNFNIVDFNNTGQIGDTIGGITAPIANLTGAILLYFALKAQIQANMLIQDQINSQKEEELIRKKTLYLSEQINMFRNDINEFSFVKVDTFGKEHSREYVNHKGSDAIYEFIYEAGHMPPNHSYADPKVIEISSLLNIIIEILKKIENENISIDDKTFYKSLIAYQFNSKLKTPFSGLRDYYNSQRSCSECGKHHGRFSIQIIDMVDNIDTIVNKGTASFE